MQYKYAKEQLNYSDFASGKVFYSLPGHPLFRLDWQAKYSNIVWPAVKQSITLPRLVFCMIHVVARLIISAYWLICIANIFGRSLPPMWMKKPSHWQNEI